MQSVDNEYTILKPCEADVVETSRGSRSADRVVVTGASSGVGQAVAARFTDRGARVVNLDIAPDEQTRTRCGPSLRSVPCDLGVTDSIVSACTSMDEEFAQRAPELLVACAAASAGGPFLDSPLSELDRLLSVNVRGLFTLCQQVGRRMRAAGGGRIVVITSVAAFQAWQREPLYCVTKGAQHSLVQAMAVELAPFNIAVNAVAPGPLESQAASMVSTRSDPEVLRHDLERIPQGRFGRPDEVAQAVEWLWQAPWMTGQTIVVDGGFMATGLGYFGAARDRLLSNA